MKTTARYELRSCKDDYCHIQKFTTRTLRGALQHLWLMPKDRDIVLVRFDAENRVQAAKRLDAGAVRWRNIAQTA